MHAGMNLLRNLKACVRRHEPAHAGRVLATYERQVFSIKD